MTHDDRELDSYRLALASLASEDAARNHCPDSERLWDAANGELTGEELRQILDHVAGCAHCLQAWRLAREVSPGSDAELAPAAPLHPAREEPRHIGRWVAAAAAAVLVVAVGTHLGRQSPGDDERGSDGPGSGAEIRSLVSEDEPLPRHQCLLRWTPGPEGSTYTLVVLTETLEEVLIEEDLRRSEYLVPEGELAQLPGEARLLWRVEIDLPDGGSRASPTFVTSID